MFHKFNLSLYTMKIIFATANKGKLREINLVVSTMMVDALCADSLRLYRYLEAKHGLKINLVEDTCAHVNQFWMLDRSNEDITELYGTV